MTIKEMEELYELHKTFDKHEKNSLMCKCGKIMNIHGDLKQAKEFIGSIKANDEDLLDYLIKINSGLRLILMAMEERLQNINFLSDKYKEFAIKNFFYLQDHIPLHKLPYFKINRNDYKKQVEENIFKRLDPEEIRHYLKRYKCLYHELLLYADDDLLAKICEKYQPIRIMYEKYLFGIEQICRKLDILAKSGKQFHLIVSNKIIEKMIEYCFANGYIGLALIIEPIKAAKKILSISKMSKEEFAKYANKHLEAYNREIAFMEDYNSIAFNGEKAYILDVCIKRDKNAKNYK